MTRRWLIRSILILLLLLFAVGWIIFRDATASQLRYSERDTVKLACMDQSIYVMWYERQSDESIGWNFESDGESSPGYLEYPVRGTLYDILARRFDFAIADRHLLGFGLNNAASAKYLSVPFWFPTLATAALLFFLWRKPRPKPTPNSAFPIDLKT